jgi:rhodanese-related sulfurtransferase
MMKCLFKGIFFLTLVSFFLGLLFSMATAQERELIKPEELKRLIDSGTDLVIVDNQPKAAYDMGHIPKAVSLPWTRQIGSANLPRNKLLILYCACDHEEDAADMAEKLWELGYRKMKLLEGGWLKWVELKYPVEKNK